MWLCLECLAIFEFPKRYTETHGLDSGPYESWAGCPHCAGKFVEAHQCDSCGEWITGEYVKTKDGQRFCENCFDTYEPGEEDSP